VHAVPLSADDPCFAAAAAACLRVIDSKLKQCVHPLRLTHIAITVLREAGHCNHQGLPSRCLPTLITACHMLRTGHAWAPSYLLCCIDHHHNQH
jgi:hypothetical protein